MRSGRVDWKAGAARLAALIPRRELNAQVEGWTLRRPARERWAVAFSGGSDSVCLLLLLWAHWPRRRKRILAIHFNHRLRGRESAADARFCRTVCRGLGIAFACGRWERPIAAAGESVARQARFQFMERVMAARRVRALWLGHQRDDVAETILMRIARGSGTSGLAAPRPVQRGAGGCPRLRPLLDLPKSAIESALSRCGLPWRQDASNATPRYFRNRVRMQVMPVWESASGRDARAGAALSRALLEEDDDALEAWVNSTLKGWRGGSLVLTSLGGLPRAVLRRCLRRWLARHPAAGELSRQGFDNFLSFVEKGRPSRFSLGKGGFAVIRRGILAFQLART